MHWNENYLYNIKYHKSLFCFSPFLLYFMLSCFSMLQVVNVSYGEFRYRNQKLLFSGP